jgi:hypothetical protein
LKCLAGKQANKNSIANKKEIENEKRKIHGSSCEAIVPGS